jgi:hypothetical protein
LKSQAASHLPAICPDVRHTGKWKRRAASEETPRRLSDGADQRCFATGRRAMSFAPKLGDLTLDPRIRSWRGYGGSPMAVGLERRRAGGHLRDDDGGRCGPRSLPKAIHARRPGSIA